MAIQTKNDTIDPYLLIEHGLFVIQWLILIYWSQLTISIKPPWGRLQLQLFKDNYCPVFHHAASGVTFVSRHKSCLPQDLRIELCRLNCPTFSVASFAWMSVNSNFDLYGSSLHHTIKQKKHGCVSIVSTFSSHFFWSIPISRNDPGRGHGHTGGDLLDEHRVAKSKKNVVD